jgi:hypothetical protein
MSKDVYFVTGINRKGDLIASKNRCWGYYFDLELAKKHVVDNVTDIAEANYYNYTVIELVDEGILPLETKEIQWFKYNVDIDKYEECEKPEWSYGVCNWSIG